uniref:Uncharacterized protein n=1 Tax=Nicotiana tabacum TaxID=4097 RepID=A0A1S3Y4E4_TOBAC|nr:PREDICTED: uncharacterized protein LOC107771820 [Nicotiana tabacum]
MLNYLIYFQCVVSAIPMLILLRVYQRSQACQNLANCLNAKEENTMLQIIVCRNKYLGAEHLIFLFWEMDKREHFLLTCLLNFESTKSRPRSLVNPQCVVLALQVLSLLKIHQSSWECQLHHAILDHIRHPDMHVMSGGSKLVAQYGATTSRFQAITYSDYCQLSNQLDTTRGTNLAALVFSTGAEIYTHTSTNV